MANRRSRQAPVLVVHGAAVRDRERFHAEVELLAESVDVDRRFIPVFWGDLARPADVIDDVLPYLGWGRNAERAGETAADELLAAAPELIAALEDDGEDCDGGDDPVLAAEQVEEQAERLIDRLGANWRRQSDAARRRVLGSVYRAVRRQYLAASSRFAGDILLYQRHTRQIQARVWQTVMREAPGWGLPERPVSVVTHSLGGSVAFDLAVAGEPRLHIDRFITCACTVPYFHVIGCSPETIRPHERGTVETLPATIGSWVNCWLPLDPWGYLVSPVFELADGSRPVDLEVHAREREDRVLRHGVTNYWRHPTVVAAIRDELTRPAAAPRG